MLEGQENIEPGKSQLTEFAQNCTIDDVKTRLKEWVNASPAEVIKESRLTAANKELALWDKIIKARETEFMPTLQLNLNHLELGELSPTLCEMGPCLSHLLIDDAGLEKLPENMGKLSKLEVFSAKDNLLSTLPESMEACTSIKWFDISNNHFEAVPECIKKMIWIDTLKLGNQDHGLESGIPIPDWLGNLPFLSTLDLNKMGLEEVPPCISRLMLANLNMAGNYIEALPDHNPFPWTLKHLNISSNEDLGTLPQWIDDLKVVELNISNCSLTSLPTLKKLRETLKSFNIEKNKLQDTDDYEDSIGALSNLTHLRMAKCGPRFNFVPACVYRLHNLKYLDISSLNLYSLEGLSAQAAKAKNTDSSAGSSNADNANSSSPTSTNQPAGTSSAQGFGATDPFNLPISEFDPGTMALMDSEFPEGISFNLPEEDIGFIPGVDQAFSPIAQVTSIKNLTSLEVLIIGNNEFDELPEEVFSLSSLKYLYANKNDISTITATLGNFAELTFLDLSENKVGEDQEENIVNYIASALKHLPVRCHVNLSGNLAITGETLEEIEAQIMAHARHNPGRGPILHHDGYDMGGAAAKWLCADDNKMGKEDDIAAEFKAIGERIVGFKMKDVDKNSPHFHRMLASNKMAVSSVAQALHRGLKEFKERPDDPSYKPQIEFRENPAVVQTNIHPSLKSIVRDGFLVPMLNQSREPTQSRSQELKMLANLDDYCNILIAALGDCDNALIVGFDSAAREIRIRQANKENWSDAERMREALQACIKKMPMTYLEFGGISTGDKMETNAFLLIHLCRSHNLMATSANQAGAPDLAGPQWMDVHEHRWHGLGENNPAGEAKRAQHVEDFLTFSYEQKLSSKHAFFDVISNHKNIKDYFVSTVPSRQTQQMLDRLDEHMQVIYDHENAGAQGQWLVEQMMDDRFFRPCLDRIHGSEFKQNEEEFKAINRELKEEGDHEDWAAKQTFDNIDLEEEAAAKSYGSYEQVTKLVTLLEKVLFISLAMEPTQRAIKEHLFPQLQIGAELLEGKGKGKAKDRERPEDSPPHRPTKKVKQEDDDAPQSSATATTTSVGQAVISQAQAEAVSLIALEKAIVGRLNKQEADVNNAPPTSVGNVDLFPLSCSGPAIEKRLLCAIRPRPNTTGNFELRKYTKAELEKYLRVTDDQARKLITESQDKIQANRGGLLTQAYHLSTRQTNQQVPASPAQQSTHDFSAHPSSAPKPEPPSAEQTTTQTLPDRGRPGRGRGGRGTRGRPRGGGNTGTS